MTLRIGTEQQERVASRGIRPGRKTARTVPVGTGTRHAVPEGQKTALCGRGPLIVAETSTWPGSFGSSTDECPTCATAARELEP